MAAPCFDTIIDAGQLASLEEVVVVDCRFLLADPRAGRRAYEEGHIPNAFYAHLDDDLSGEVVPGVTGRHPLPEPEAFTRLARAWGVSSRTQVVAYDDHGGAIAARLWWLLRYFGHACVAVLDGGFAAWREAGFAVSRTQPVPSAGDFRARPRMEMTASIGEVERACLRDAARLLDARAPERFRGEQEPVDPVAGHIPGARSLPFATLLENGRFRSAEALRARLDQALAGAAASDAIAYCGSGVTACHLVLAAHHAGHEGLRLYPGSFSEWICDPKHQVERGS